MQIGYNSTLDSPWGVPAPWKSDADPGGAKRGTPRKSSISGGVHTCPKWAVPAPPFIYEDLPPAPMSRDPCNPLPTRGGTEHRTFDRFWGGGNSSYFWGMCAPPSEIDDFPGVPLLGPPGSASDFKGAGTPHGESNVELYPICKRCSADPLKRGVR